jgi:hypothetical protein
MTPPCGGSLQNDAGFQAVTEPNGTICSSTSTPALVLRNFGANTVSSVTISYHYDNASFNTFHWTGTLLAGNTSTVTLPSTTLSAGPHTFMAFTTSPNGQTDANLDNDTIISTLNVSTASGSITLNLTTDNQGSKTTWQITDQGSNIIASGGPYPNLVGGTTYAIPLCLPLGCYTFTIFSSQNNGMTSGEDGTFSLVTTDGTGTILAALTSASFGSQEAHTFCVGPASVTDLPALSFSVTPNPSSGKFNISVSSSDEKNCRVYDITGRIIFERKTSNPDFVIDLNNESKGVYLLQIETIKGRAIQKLILK